MTTTIEQGTSSEPGERPYAPRGAALELMYCKAREVLLSGPAGTGKSRAALEKINLVAMQKPIRAAIVRKVRSRVTQSAMITFEQKVLPQPSAVKWHDTDQEYRYPNGARVVVAGLDDPDKLGSTEFDMVYVQEATELDEQDWGMLLRGLRNNQLSYQQLLADCNPSYPHHWLKRRCDEGKTVLMESRHEDNPLLFNDDGTHTDFGTEYIRTLDSLTGFQYQRLRLGLWVAAEGMYFQDWDPSLHITPQFDIPRHWPRWLAVDYGFAAPFCCLWFAREPETRTVYVYRELYSAGLRDELQVQHIIERSAGEEVAMNVLDPSMFNQRREQMRPSIAWVYAMAGLDPLVQGMNNRKQGWAIVRRALAHRTDQEGNPIRPRLQVLEGCAPNLVRTLPTMVVDPLDPEDVADVVNSQKTEDHAVDALRYGLCAEAQPEEPTEPEDFRWG
jgi:PBSX family phage terminase large subunit